MPDRRRSRSPLAAALAEFWNPTRYAAEAAAPTLGKPARRRTRAKQVQELLGDHQDAAVSLDVLRELGAEAHLDGGNGFIFGLLYQKAAGPAPDAV